MLAALVSGWLQSGVTAPILEVAHVAREVMNRRDYALRARKTSEDEIGELVDAFNGMLAEAGRRAEADAQLAVLGVGDELPAVLDGDAGG